MHLEEARRNRQASASTPVDTEERSAPETANARITPEQEWVTAIHQELDDYLVELRSMRSKDPVEVFMTLSSITARLTEIRVICVRSESRRLTSLRTREIDPMIEECERQFRFHSRIQSTRQMDWDMAKGQM